MSAVDTCNGTSINSSDGHHYDKDGTNSAIEKNREHRKERPKKLDAIPFSSFSNSGTFRTYRDLLFEVCATLGSSSSSSSKVSTSYNSATSSRNRTRRPLIASTSPSASNESTGDDRGGGHWPPIPTIWTGNLTVPFLLYEFATAINHNIISPRNATSESMSLPLNLSHRERKAYLQQAMEHLTKHILEVTPLPPLWSVSNKYSSFHYQYHETANRAKPHKKTNNNHHTHPTSRRQNQPRQGQPPVMKLLPTLLQHDAMGILALEIAIEQELFLSSQRQSKSPSKHSNHSVNISDQVKQYLQEIQKRLVQMPYYKNDNNSSNVNNRHVYYDTSIQHGLAGVLHLIGFLRYILQAPRLFATHVHQIVHIFYQQQHQERFGVKGGLSLNQDDDDKNCDNEIKSFPKTPSTNSFDMLYMLMCVCTDQDWEAIKERISQDAPATISVTTHASHSLSSDMENPQQHLQITIRQLYDSVKEVLVEISVQDDGLASKQDPMQTPQKKRSLSSSLDDNNKVTRIVPFISRLFPHLYWEDGGMAGYVWFLLKASQVYQCQEYLQQAETLSQYLWQLRDEWLAKALSRDSNKKNSKNEDSLSVCCSLAHGASGIAMIFLQFSRFCSSSTMRLLWEKRAEWCSRQLILKIQRQQQEQRRHRKQQIQQGQTTSNYDRNHLPVLPDYGLYSGRGGLASLLLQLERVAATKGKEDQDQFLTQSTKEIQSLQINFPTLQVDYRLWGSDEIPILFWEPPTGLTIEQATTVMEDQLDEIVMPLTPSQERVKKMREKKELRRNAIFCNLPTPQKGHENRQGNNDAPVTVVSSPKSVRDEKSSNKNPRVDVHTKMHFVKKENDKELFWSLSTESNIGNEDHYKPSLFQKVEEEGSKNHSAPPEPSIRKEETEEVLTRLNTDALKAARGAQNEKREEKKKILSAPVSSTMSHSKADHGNNQHVYTKSRVAGHVRPTRAQQLRLEHMEKKQRHNNGRFTNKESPLDVKRSKRDKRAIETPKLSMQRSVDSSESPQTCSKMQSSVRSKSRNALVRQRREAARLKAIRLEKERRAKLESKQAQSKRENEDRLAKAKEEKRVREAKNRARVLKETRLRRERKAQREMQEDTVKRMKQVKASNVNARLERAKQVRKSLDQASQQIMKERKKTMQANKANQKIAQEKKAKADAVKAKRERQSLELKKAQQHQLGLAKMLANKLQQLNSPVSDEDTISTEKKNRCSVISSKAYQSLGSSPEAIDSRALAFPMNDDYIAKRLNIAGTEQDRAQTSLCEEKDLEDNSFEEPILVTKDSGINQRVLPQASTPNISKKMTETSKQPVENLNGENLAEPLTPMLDDTRANSNPREILQSPTLSSHSGNGEQSQFFEANVSYNFREMNQESSPEKHDFDEVYYKGSTFIIGSSQAKVRNKEPDGALEVEKVSADQQPNNSKDSILIETISAHQQQKPEMEEAQCEVSKIDPLQTRNGKSAISHDNKKLSESPTDGVITTTKKDIAGDPTKMQIPSDQSEESTIDDLIAQSDTEILDSSERFEELDQMCDGICRTKTDLGLADGEAFDALNAIFVEAENQLENQLTTILGPADHSLSESHQFTQMEIAKEEDEEPQEYSLQNDRDSTVTHFTSQQSCEIPDRDDSVLETSTTEDEPARALSGEKDTVVSKQGEHNLEGKIINESTPIVTEVRIANLLPVGDTSKSERGENLQGAVLPVEEFQIAMRKRRTDFVSDSESDTKSQKTRQDVDDENQMDYGATLDAVDHNDGSHGQSSASSSVSGCPEGFEQMGVLFDETDNLLQAELDDILGLSDANSS